MTDEQKFRLLEWMKSMTAHLELLAPPAAEIVKDDLKRFEQSLEVIKDQAEHGQQDHDRHLLPGDKREFYGNLK